MTVVIVTVADISGIPEHFAQDYTTRMSSYSQLFVTTLRQT